MFCCLSVCVLQATNLTPTDPNGKADPYLVVRVGQQSQDTKDRYIPKQLNPTFGESVPVCLPAPVWRSLTVCLSFCLTVSYLWRCLSGCLNSQCPSRSRQIWLSEFWTTILWGLMMSLERRGLTWRTGSTAATEPPVDWLCTMTR